MMKYEDYVIKEARRRKISNNFDDAFRTADYATPIWKCETDFQRGIKQFSEVIIPLAIVIAVIFLSIYGIYYWLGK